MMLARQAREVARRWVREEAVAVPGFGGAFLSGSASYVPEDVLLEPGSDVDVLVVVDGDERPARPGTLCYEGVRLEVGFISSLRLQCAVSILCDARLAGSFCSPNVLADPSGHLTVLHERVAREFTNRRWVQVRCADAMDRLRRRLGGLGEEDSLAEQVLVWASGTSMATHALLVAACRDPLVRHPFVAIRALLADRGRLDYHEVLLYLLGCAGLGRGQVAAWLAALARAYDAVPALVAPGFREEADGCRALIERGLHREAVGWLVMSYARCSLRLSAAGVDSAGLESDFAALLGTLGAQTYADRRRRAERVLTALPELWLLAESIMA